MWDIDYVQLGNANWCGRCGHGWIMQMEQTGPKRCHVSDIKPDCEIVHFIIYILQVLVSIEHQPPYKICAVYEKRFQMTLLWLLL